MGENGETIAATVAESTPVKAEISPSLGYVVSKVEFTGPSGIGEKAGPFSTGFTGLTVEGRGITMAVVRGGLTGQTYVTSYDHATGQQEIAIFSPTALESFTQASERMTPFETAELLLAARNLQTRERVDRRAKITAVGGRNAYLATESARLVNEGKFLSIPEARAYLVNTTETWPQYQKTEEELKKAANTGELPKDIEGDEAQQLDRQLQELAEAGNFVELAHLLPRLERVAGKNAQGIANQARELMTTTLDSLGSQKQTGVPESAIAPLTQMDLQPTQEMQKVVDYLTKKAGL